MISTVQRDVVIHIRVIKSKLFNFQRIVYRIHQNIFQKFAEFSICDKKREAYYDKVRRFRKVRIFHAQLSIRRLFRSLYRRYRRVFFPSSIGVCLFAWV